MFWWRINGLRRWRFERACDRAWHAVRLYQDRCLETFDYFHIRAMEDREHIEPPRSEIYFQPEGMPFDLVSHLYRQRAFSEQTFGPGPRTAGVLDHIRRELREIEAAPEDMYEWVDVLILAFDGAMRAGYLPGEICAGLVEKQTRNERRRWPDWRLVDPDRAIEHERACEKFEEEA